MNAVARKLSQLSESFAVYKDRAQQMVNDVITAPKVSQKLKHFQQAAFEMRLAHFLIKGYLNDKISPYDDDFKQKLESNRINEMSVNTIIHDFEPSANADNGHCFERSFLMFMCVDDALWVQGDNKILELKYGKEDASHAWVEVGNSVYDPTTLLKYPKDLYYKMLKVSNVIKLSHKDIAQRNDIAPKLLTMVNYYLSTIKGQVQNQNCQTDIEK